MERRPLRITDHVETRKGNYLLLNQQETEAIKSYTRGSQILNMLFNTDSRTIITKIESLEDRS